VLAAEFCRSPLGCRSLDHADLAPVALNSGEDLQVSDMLRNGQHPLRHEAFEGVQRDSVLLLHVVLDFDHPGNTADGA
jgi:hypothetical protein